MQLNKVVRYLLLGLFVIFLIAVRAFESQLFYDPFLSYFKSEFYNLPYPQYNSTFLFLNLSFRYFVNSFLSLGIIFFIFNDSSIVKFSGLLLFLFWIVLLVLMFFY